MRPENYQGIADHIVGEIRELKARLAEAERDAARYRFIKQWARRLDITGYSLTNNEHFEPRIDEAMKRRPADSADPALAWGHCEKHDMIAKHGKCADCDSETVSEVTK